VQPVEAVEQLVVEEDKEDVGCWLVDEQLVQLSLEASSPVQNQVSL
jgi:hypothetical protein